MYNCFVLSFLSINITKYSAEELNDLMNLLFKFVKKCSDLAAFFDSLVLA